MEIKKSEIILELGSIKSRQELHLLLQKELKLDPEENFIGNWNYFNDVIAGYVFPERIGIKGWEKFKTGLPWEAEVFLRILERNIGYQNSAHLKSPDIRVLTNIEFIDE